MSTLNLVLPLSLSLSLFSYVCETLILDIVPSRQSCQNFNGHRGKEDRVCTMEKADMDKQKKEKNDQHCDFQTAQTLDRLLTVSFTSTGAVNNERTSKTKPFSCVRKRSLSASLIVGLMNSWAELEI